MHITLEAITSWARKATGDVPEPMVVSVPMSSDTNTQHHLPLHLERPGAVDYLGDHSTSGETGRNQNSDLGLRRKVCTDTESQ